MANDRRSKKFDGLTGTFETSRDEDRLDSPVAFTGHRDPFQGMCIHGVPGARFVDGRLTNYDCTHCSAEYD